MIKANTLEWILTTICDEVQSSAFEYLEDLLRLLANLLENSKFSIFLLLFKTSDAGVTTFLACKQLRDLLSALGGRQQVILSIIDVQEDCVEVFIEIITQLATNGEP